MNNLPQSRDENIVVQSTDQEILIYDLITNKAFCLNETAAIVYLACDGNTNFDNFKRKTGFSDDLIHLTLDELKKKKLISENFPSKFEGISRRKVIRKIGLSSLVALPLIVSLTAPNAYAAVSTCSPNMGGGGNGVGGVCYCLDSDVPVGEHCGTDTSGLSGTFCKGGCHCYRTPCPPMTFCFGVCG